MDFEQDMVLGANLYDDASSGILGVPNAQADFWDMQEFADNCEPTSESFIIRQFGFDNISTNDFAYISQANGWYVPGGGTNPEHIGEMMDLFGIENHTLPNASLDDLAREIAEGHGVIVGVRSNQLWEQGPLQELWNWFAKTFGFDNPWDQPADHALCVTGFDVSDPDHPMVIVNDPGHPEGAGQAYPLDRFMDAWENSNFHMTATDDPLPSFRAFSIRDSVSQYLADNDIQMEGPMLADSISDGGADDLRQLASEVDDFAQPLISIFNDVADVIASVAGVFIAGNILSVALSGDDFAYSI
ncbi:MAG: C39 family peptidase [Kiritimatiellae bacterium]|nr:C39 family peptidase [Kiritimatiellia bacterium]